VLLIGLNLVLSDSVTDNLLYTVVLPSLLFSGVFEMAKWLGRVCGNFCTCSAESKNVSLYTFAFPCHHDFHMKFLKFLVISYSLWVFSLYSVVQSRSLFLAYFRKGGRILKFAVIVSKNHYMFGQPKYVQRFKKMQYLGHS
jgi:hypothetical protein